MRIIRLVVENAQGQAEFDIDKRSAPWKCTATVRETLR